MRRKAPELPPASDPLIATDGVNRNTVMRVGAFPEVQAKKLPWVEAIVAELSPAKAHPTKSLTLSQGVDISGVDTRSPRRLADWPGDICAKRDMPSTGRNATAAYGGDPEWPTIRAAQVNGIAIEAAGFPSGSPKTGGRTASAADLRE